MRDQRRAQKPFKREKVAGPKKRKYCVTQVLPAQGGVEVDESKDYWG